MFVSSEDRKIAEKVMDSKVWVQQRFCAPVIATASTPDCVQLFNRLNVRDLAHMLFPFRNYPNDLYITAVRDADPHTLRNFNVRFFGKESIAEIDSPGRTSFFAQFMSNNGLSLISNSEKYSKLFAQICDSPNIHAPELTPDEGGQLLAATYSPWFDIMSREYIHALRFSYFDCVDHPTAILLSVTTQFPPDQDLVAALKEAESNIVQLLEDNITADLQLPRIILLFHDVVNGPPDAQVRQLKQQLMARFAKHVQVIEMNKRPPGIGDGALGPLANSDAWDVMVTPYRIDPIHRRDDQQSTLPPVEIQDVDRITLQREINKLMKEFIVPQLQRKARELVLYIDKNRVTALGKMAAWFRSDDSKKSQKEAFVRRDREGRDIRYWYHSVEMHIRRAADYSMFLGDFSSAIYFYKMLRDDLTSSLKERAFNRSLIAAANEGVAMAQLLQGRLTLPVDSLTDKIKTQNKLEIARDTYNVSSVYSYSFRTMIFSYRLCRRHSPPAIDQARVQLIRALNTGLGPLYSAVINEELALCQAVMNPPYPIGDVLPLAPSFTFQLNPRKYAFQLMKAAGLYFGLPMRREYAFASDVTRPEYAALSRHLNGMGLLHGLRCVLRAWTIYRRRGGRTWPQLTRSIMRHVAEKFCAMKRQIFTDRAIGVYTRLVHSGHAHRADYDAVLNLLRLRQRTSPSIDATPTYQTVLPAPVIDLRLSRVSINVYGEDETSLSGADEIRRTGMANGCDPYRCEIDGAACLSQEMEAMADILRKDYASTRYLFPRSLAAFEHQRAGLNSKKHKMFSLAGTTASACVLDTKHVIMLGEQLAVKLALTNPFLSEVGSQVQITKIALLYIQTELVGTTVDTNNTSNTDVISSTHSQTPAILVGTELQESWILRGKETVIVALPFSVHEPGSYAIVGMQATVEGIPSRVFFASPLVKPQRPFREEQRKLVTDEDDILTAGALTEQCNKIATAVPAENAAYIYIRVESNAAQFALRFDPPLPSQMRDGEFFRTTLIGENKSPTQEPIVDLRLVISACCWHTLYLYEEDSSDDDTSPSAGISIVEHIARAHGPGAAYRLIRLNSSALTQNNRIKVKVVLRAQHGPAGDSIIGGVQEDHTNSFIFLASYAAAGSQRQIPVSPSVSSPVSTLCFHKMMRRCRVSPSIALSSQSTLCNTAALPSLIISLSVASKVSNKGTYQSEANNICINHISACLSEQWEPINLMKEQLIMTCRQPLLPADRFVLCLGISPRASDADQSRTLTTEEIFVGPNDVLYRNHDRDRLIKCAFWRHVGEFILARENERHTAKNGAAWYFARRAAGRGAGVIGPTPRDDTADIEGMAFYHDGKEDKTKEGTHATVAHFRESRLEAFSPESAKSTVNNIIAVGWYCVAEESNSELRVDDNSSAGSTAEPPQLQRIPAASRNVDIAVGLSFLAVDNGKLFESMNSSSTRSPITHSAVLSVTPANIPRFVYFHDLESSASISFDVILMMSPVGCDDGNSDVLCTVSASAVLSGNDTGRVKGPKPQHTPTVLVAGESVQKVVLRGTTRTARMSFTAVFLSCGIFDLSELILVEAEHSPAIMSSIQVSLEGEWLLNVVPGASSPLTVSPGTNPSVKMHQAPPVWCDVWGPVDVDLSSNEKTSTENCIKSIQITGLQDLLSDL